MRFPWKKQSLVPVFLALAAWIFFLRWPHFGRPTWNLDEGIHATIARTILDGGVMYRDAIDQRTPLTYYLVAGIFRIFGENNMGVLHAFLAGMIAATALGIFLIAHRWRGAAMAWWSALIFCAFSTNLLYIGDANALNTEWFVILFTTWSTWWFWRSWEEKSPWNAALAGAGFAAAFLSKQPGLLDLGAPLATLVYALAAGRLNRRQAALGLLGLCTGGIVVVGTTLAYFWSKGAIHDLFFYAWTYNLCYYGPETTSADRFRAAIAAITQIWQHYPVLCLAVAGGAATLVIRLVQLRPSPTERAENPAAFYTVTWAALSLAGAASAGRQYGHYFIQFFPAFALLGGGLLADVQSSWQISREKALKLLAVIGLAAAGWSVIAGPLKGAWPASVVPEAGLDVAAFVRTHSKPDDKIFVWGYNPDFYLYADRRSASRYIYCSFLTGLIPWTNIEPGRDTRYAIVPGAMPDLLQELATRRPEFIVDASLGQYRHFDKYPIEAFPQLRDFILKEYVLVGPPAFAADGFRVHLLKDSGRLKPLALAGGPPDGQLGEPTLTGPTQADQVPTRYTVTAAHPAGKLQRIELLVDNQVLDGVTFQPARDMETRLVVPFDRLGQGRHQLTVRSTSASGETKTGGALTVDCGPLAVAAEKLPSFALPFARENLSPTEIRAPFGAVAGREAGHLIFSVHAPSSIEYPLNQSPAIFRGRFGFRPGAWGPENPARTDGADFLIEIVQANGSRSTLLRRALRPVENPADRDEQEFEVAIPASAVRLQLIITNGPAGNASSDWTYWTDLLLINSH